LEIIVTAVVVFPFMLFLELFF